MTDQFEAFGVAVELKAMLANEREECAKIAEEYYDNSFNMSVRPQDAIAKAIRARPALASLPAKEESMG